MSRPLTDRQQAILAAIRSHLTQYGWPPTIRELGTALGIHSPNGVRAHLVALERKGYVQRDPRTARGIRLLPRQ